MSLTAFRSEARASTKAGHAEQPHPTNPEGECGYCGGPVRVTWARTAHLHDAWRTGPDDLYQIPGNTCPGSYDLAVQTTGPASPLPDVDLLRVELRDARSNEDALRAQCDQGLVSLRESDTQLATAVREANVLRSQLAAAQGELKKARKQLRSAAQAAARPAPVRMAPAGGWDAGVDWAQAQLLEMSTAMRAGIDRTGPGPQMVNAHRLDGVERGIARLRAWRGGAR
jgi:hypothetical protein